MAQIQQTQRGFCPYSILGLHHSSSQDEVGKAYQRLINVFAEDNFMSTPQSWVQAQQAFLSIENAYQQIVRGEATHMSSECSEGQQEIPAKLGQILVAAGLITYEQLEEAIAKQSTVNLPLGEILKSSSLITQMELDSFLLNQRLIKLPPDSPYQIGQRLMGLGLITEDMLRIALVEQRTTQTPLGQILVNRGWLAKDILDAILAGEWHSGTSGSSLN